MVSFVLLFLHHCEPPTYVLSSIQKHSTLKIHHDILASFESVFFDCVSFPNRYIKACLSLEKIKSDTPPKTDIALKKKKTTFLLKLSFFSGGHAHF